MRPTKQKQSYGTRNYREKITGTNYKQDRGRRAVPDCGGSHLRDFLGSSPRKSTETRDSGGGLGVEKRNECGPRLNDGTTVFTYFAGAEGPAGPILRGFIPFPPTVSREAKDTRQEVN